MPERKIDPLYKIPRLNLVFAVSSILLLATALWIYWDDYNRPWKAYQREFKKLELERTQADLDATNAAIQKEQGDTLAQLEAQLKDADASIVSKETELQAARARVEELEAAFYPADQSYKFKKAQLDVKRFEAEDAAERGLPTAEEKARIVQEYTREWHELGLKVEEVQKELDAANAAVDAIEGERETVAKEIKDITRERDRIAGQISKLAPTLDRDGLGAVAAARGRNLPLLDFVSPSIKVNQIVVPTLLDDIGFETTVPKVERCTTCHLAIDKPGWDSEEIPAVFQSHPRITVPEDAPEGARPDFLTALSPHPIGEFACTVCHGGLGQAIQFDYVYHTPQSSKQEHEWEEKYHYHRGHYWDFPMKPLQYTEAGCVKCHSSSVDVPGGEKVSMGKHLFQKMGCFGCHNVSGQGFDRLRKVGPDLRKLKAKVEPDWAYRWIRSPRSFRPSTRMPHMYDLENISGEEDMQRSSVLVDGIVTYLMENSQAFDLPTYVPSGDPTTGEELFDSVGCRGCHVVGDEQNGATPGFEDFGPNLAGVGSKLTEPWLYQWVKNPREYFPETKMPDLRLSEQESADIAAYLATLKLEDVPTSDGGTQAEVFASVRRDPRDAGLIEELAVAQLHKTMRLDEAQERAAGMSETEKLAFIGSREIARQGCFGCHMIPGYEEAQPIGTDLTDQGRKLTTRLDFGFESTHVPEPKPDALPHALPEFVYNKLLTPRRYDRGKIKTFDEKLKMPHFGFTEAEAEAITTFVLGLTKEPILQSRKKNLSEREQAIEDGRWLVRQRNCMGCHVIEEKGGDIRAFYSEEELGDAPPVLYKQGGKVQSDWLFAFFKEPSTIRPWLSVRMPTFHFNDEEARILARYFAAYDEEPYPFVTRDLTEPSAERKVAAEALFKQCLQCHVAGDIVPPGKDSAQLAPDLLQARDRLRYKWVFDWLVNPQGLAPGTKMPNFFYDEGNPLYEDADDQIAALRYHIYTVDPEVVLAEAAAAAEAAEAALAAAEEMGDDEGYE